MDFRRALTSLIEAFSREGIRYGAIGGLAVGALGWPRATGDLDFLVRREDLDRADAALRDLGYRLVRRTENLSQYEAGDATLGRVDFLHAFRPASLKMLDRTRPLPVLNGSLTVPVVETEDVIALKVQAMANDPARKAQDLADVEALLRLHGASVDWARLREFFELFRMSDLLEELEGRYRC